MCSTNKSDLGPNSQLTGLKGSATKILVPDSTAQLQGLVESMPPWVRAVLGTNTILGGHNVMSDWCIFLLCFKVTLCNLLPENTSLYVFKICSFKFDFDGPLYMKREY